jgi:hypothetical protein
MNKILQKELLSVIKSIKSTAKVGIDFVKEQAPDIVNQILKYEAVTKGICFVMWVIAATMLVLFDIFVLIKAIPFFIEGTSEKYILSYFTLLGAVNFFGLGALSSTMSSFQGFLKVLVAPKVFLLEYIKNIIDNNE